jgi:hypothetical protein
MTRLAVIKPVALGCHVATRKLTKKTIDALPIRDRVYIAYDSVLPGFGCRVTPNGARSWIVEYRPHGGGPPQYQLATT